MNVFDYRLHVTGTTLDELAERTGMNRPLLSNIKNGRVNARPDELAKIGEALGVPPSMLLKEVVVDLPPFGAEATGEVAAGVR